MPVSAAASACPCAASATPPYQHAEGGEDGLLDAALPDRGAVAMFTCANTFFRLDSADLSVGVSRRLGLSPAPVSSSQGSARTQSLARLPAVMHWASLASATHDREV